MLDMLKVWFDGIMNFLMNRGLSAVIILAVGIMVGRIIMTVVDKALNKSKLEKAAHSLIRSLLKATLYILLGLIVASKLGVDVTGIIALASVLSLAVSLAVQDVLSNVFGGLTLLYTQPFHSGDYVEIAGQSGTVKEIGLTYTQYITMMVLWENRSCSAKKLGEKLYLDSGTLTPVIKSLEQKGFVKRSRSAVDERVLMVEVTDKGFALREEAKSVPQKMAACTNLTPEEAQTLYKLLYKVLAHVDERNEREAMK